MKAFRAIAEVIAREGITHVFGVPGGYTVRIFDGLFDERDRVRCVLATHEQAASCMADIYGRMTGKPGVLIGQGPFIGSSGAFGVMEAFLASSPMVVLTDTSDFGVGQHAPMQAATGDYGTIGLPQIFSGITKYSTLATTPNEAVHGVELAFAHATAGRPGPTAVIMRGSAIDGDADPEVRPRFGSTRAAERAQPSPADEDVARVARMLAEADRPVLVAGNGIHRARAHEDLATVAHGGGIPVVTSMKGKGAIAEDDPWCAGPLGRVGDPVANYCLAGADVVVVLGSRLNPNDTLLGSAWLLDGRRQTIVQVDVEQRHLGWTTPVRLGLTADVGVFLRRLAGALRVDRKVVEARAARLAELRAAHGEDPPELRDGRSPLLPQRLVQVLNENLAPEDRVVLDAGNNRLFMCRFFTTRTPGNLFLPGGMAGMGWGPCAAVGAGIVDPSRRTVAVVGDGGMLMTVHVLATAAEHGLPVTFIIMNNGGLANVRDAQGERKIAVDFPPLDFAAVASAFGVEGRRVERDSDLADALKQTAAQGGPALIDVAVDPAEPFTKIVQRDPTRKRRAAPASEG